MNTNGRNPLSRGGLANQIEELASKNAVVVARVSTSGQTDNTSFDVQYEAAMKKAEAMGLNIVRYYQETNTGAGYLTRTETQKALHDLEIGLAKSIIFYDFSRFSRDREYQEVMFKRIEAAGGRLVLCSQDFEDNPEGHLTRNLMGDLAAYERRKINERCSNGRRKKLEQGVMVYRVNPAFGYHIVTKNDIIRGSHPVEAEGTYEIIEAQAFWVRKVFELYATGHSVNHIVRHLYENGVRTNKGNIWDRSNITDMIRRTVYKGQCAVNKTRQVRDESRLALGLSEYYAIEVPPSEWTFLPAPVIVEVELWEAANRRIAKGRLNSGRPEKRYPFAGLLLCPGCGRKLGGRKMTRRGRTEERYECNYSKQGKNLFTTCTEKRAFNAAKIERMVTEALTLVATRRHIIERAYKDYAADNSKDEFRFEQLQGMLEQLQKKEVVAASKQIEAEVEGRSGAVYDSILREVAVQKTAIENQIRDVAVLVESKSEHKEKSQIVADIMDEVTIVLSEGKDLLTGAERNRLFSTIVERIEIVESLDRGIVLQLKNDGQEVLVVRHLDEKVEMNVQHPGFMDKSSASPNLHHN